MHYISKVKKDTPPVSFSTGFLKGNNELLISVLTSHVLQIYLLFSFCIMFLFCLLNFKFLLALIRELVNYFYLNKQSLYMFDPSFRKISYMVDMAMK